MIILIAMLFGNWDPISLTLMASVNACMNLFGLLHERMNEGRDAKNVTWEAFWMGCFAGAVPWAAIFAYLASSPDLGRIPGFVWGILAAYLFFFVSRQEAAPSSAPRFLSPSLTTRAHTHLPCPLIPEHVSHQHVDAVQAVRLVV